MGDIKEALDRYNNLLEFVERRIKRGKGLPRPHRVFALNELTAIKAEILEDIKELKALDNPKPIDCSSAGSLTVTTQPNYNGYIVSTGHPVVDYRTQASSELRDALADYMRSEEPAVKVAPSRHTPPRDRMEEDWLELMTANSANDLIKLIKLLKELGRNTDIDEFAEKEPSRGFTHSLKSDKPW